MGNNDSQNMLMIVKTS